MAENNLQEILKPFYQRASEAETRLESLEAAIASERNSGNEELLKKTGELDSKLEEAKAEQASEREKVQKELQQLKADNAKLQYRITHLVRALKDADSQVKSRLNHHKGQQNCNHNLSLPGVKEKTTKYPMGDTQENACTEQERFQIRRLEISDKRKGFIELLEQLTVCESVSDRDFEEHFQELANRGDEHVICVIEDSQIGKIVATGSVFIEKKFIRNCGKVGHIEDVVVDSSIRGMQLGKKIVAFLTDHACSMGCYKVILDCSMENKPFYEKCGYKQKEVQMVKYFI